MKSQTGIWLNSKKAVIFTLMDDSQDAAVLEVAGGSQLQQNGEKNGVQDLQRRNFIGKIIDRLDPDSDIVVLGPSQTKLELAGMLHEHPTFKSKDITIRPAESLSVEQVVAKVLDYFNPDLED